MCTCRNCPNRDPEKTPRTRSVLDRALGLAKTEGRGYWGAEHIFLALSQDSGGPAFTMLQKLGVTPHQVQCAYDLLKEEERSGR